MIVIETKDGVNQLASHVFNRSSVHYIEVMYACFHFILLLSLTLSLFVQIMFSSIFFFFFFFASCEDKTPNERWQPWLTAYCTQIKLPQGKVKIKKVKKKNKKTLSVTYQQRPFWQHNFCRKHNKFPVLFVELNDSRKKAFTNFHFCEKTVSVTTYISCLWRRISY